MVSRGGGSHAESGRRVSVRSALAAVRHPPYIRGRGRALRSPTRSSEARRPRPAEGGRPGGVEPARVSSPTSCWGPSPVRCALKVATRALAPRSGSGADPRGSRAPLQARRVRCQSAPCPHLRHGGAGRSGVLPWAGCSSSCSQVAAAGLRRCPPRPASLDAPTGCLALAGSRGTPFGCTPPAGPRQGRLAFADALGRPGTGTAQPEPQGADPLDRPAELSPAACLRWPTRRICPGSAAARQSGLVVSAVTIREPLPLPPARFPVVSRTTRALAPGFAS